MRDTQAAGSPADSSETPVPADVQLLARLRAATIGEYEVYGELGRGGMATVFLAREIALDRKVAIKVMAPALVYGDGMVERFKREARTAAQLSHPNIIPIFAVREAEGLLFFVMKLVDGTPLDTIMRESGPLPVPMVEAILAQIGGAFGYAHRRGVVHRDIKPSNILIDDEGWAVVTDFGIAKVDESEQLTQSGVAVGTPTYMSPEQCNGGTITGASDQYSLGIVTYEMLAGRPPFVSASPMALMYCHFHDTPTPLETLRPDCPEPLRVAVARMLAKEPAQRWTSMEELVQEIGAVPLAHDDPTRSHLIRLARTGASHRIIQQIQTPRSPVPLTREGKKISMEAPAPRRGLARWFVAGGSLVAAAAVVALLLRPKAPEALLVTPVPPPAVTESPGPAPAPTPAQTKPQSTVQTPPPRDSARRTAPPPRQPVAGVQKPTTPETGAVASARPDSVVLAPAPPPAPAPTPPPPAAVPPTAPVVDNSVATAPPPVTVVDERANVTDAIMGYARALQAGDLAEARRIYPDMPADQRQGLEAFWKSGGTMQPRWTVSDITVTGDVATARIQGTNTVTAANVRPTEERVSLRARLQRRGTTWRLLALVN